MEKRKVIFFTPPAVGGAERVTITIAKILDKDKYDITIAIIGKDYGNIVDFIPDYMHIRQIKTKNIWDIVTLRIWKFLRKEKPDAVFCSAIYLNSRVICAAKVIGEIKIIIRNNNDFGTIRNDHKLFAKLTYPMADTVILQTDEMKKEIEMLFPNVNRNKFVVLSNPIDTDYIDTCINNAASPFDSATKNYVFVGRIEKIKGLDILIPAFAKVIKDNPYCKLYIIGKINEQSLYYQKLLTTIKTYEIVDNVVWVGYTRNPYVYVKFADCLILPSRKEGLPNVLLDALYLKTPIVATRSVPAIDRIVHQDRGIVVNVEDMDGLASAMKQAVNMIIDTNIEYNSVVAFKNLFL